MSGLRPSSLLRTVLRTTVRAGLAIGLAAPLLTVASPARAQLSAVRIQEVLVSWFGDGDFQFVELRQLGGQAVNLDQTVLGAFGAGGVHLGDLGTVSSVGLARDDRLLFGTQEVANERNSVDVLIDPDLPAAGMLCWGAPVQMDGTAPDPASWDHSDPANYIDCVAYGGYTGPIPSTVGNPISRSPQGNSLHRVFDASDNLADFRCGTPSPHDQFFDVATYLMASTPCPDPRFYTLDEPLAFAGTASIDTSHDLVGTVLPVNSLDGFDEFPQCTTNSNPCFQPLGDTVFFRLEVGPGSDPIRGIGGIVTTDGPIRLSAPQAGWNPPDDPMSPLLVPDGGNNFGHGYNGFSRGVDWDVELVDGEQSTVLFVQYPVGSVERAIAEGGGIAAEVFGPSGTGSLETTVPEPDALLAGLTAAPVVAVARRRRRR